MATSSSTEITCRVSGGLEDTDIEHILEVKDRPSSDDESKIYLTALSEQLTILKDLVNVTLSGLVDKEKALLVNGSRQKEYEDSSDSGTMKNFLSST